MGFVWGVLLCAAWCSWCCDGVPQRRGCWHVLEQDGRVRVNVGHQGEELTYRLVSAALSKAAPAAVWWPWPIMDWSRELLQATMPKTELSMGPDAPQPRACSGGVAAVRRIRPIVREAQWRGTGTHAKARAAVYKSCGLREAASGGSFVVRVLERADAAEAVSRAAQRAEMCGGGGLKRRLAKTEALAAAASAAANNAGVAIVFQNVTIPNDNPGSLCDQVRRFHGADVLISIHGAHLVNAPFLQAGALLFEVLPFAHKKKQHHSRLLLQTDIAYDKLCGVRPIGLGPAHHDEKFCEGRSQAARTCSAKARDCFETALRPAGDKTCATGKVDRCECMGRFAKSLTTHFKLRNQTFE